MPFTRQLFKLLYISKMDLVRDTIGVSGGSVEEDMIVAQAGLDVL
ncbi:heme-binding protein [Acetobacterium malicum]|nr:heme-binding protein [Acetobacterium malicum]